jgi:hypothetical protein
LSVGPDREAELAGAAGAHQELSGKSLRLTRSSSVQFAWRSIIDMGIALMGPDLADEIKAVAIEGGNQLPGGE